jgi:hypothetical protein
MNNDLVEQAGTKALRSQVGSKEDDSLASGCVFGGRHRLVHGTGNEREGRMGIRVGRPVRQHEHRPFPLSSVDPVVAVELANSDVVPAPAAKDRSGTPKNLVSDGATLHLDVACLLPTGGCPAGC